MYIVTSIEVPILAQFMGKYFSHTLIVRQTQGTQALAMYIGVYVWHVLYHAVNSVIAVQWMHPSRQVYMSTWWMNS